jgi:acetylornithine aminotransferase
MSQFEEIKKRDAELVCSTYGRYPVAVERAKGCRVWDFEGKEYIDLLAGIAVISVGHCNEEIAEVMEKQARKLIHVSNLFYHEEQLELAERLLKTNHCGKVFFCNSGAEANEGAFKLARRYNQRVKENGRFEIISFANCFHGRTLATVAATGRAKFQDGFAPMPAGFLQVPMGDIDALRKAIGSNTAAVIMEMVQGEGGVMPVDEDFVKAAYALCREKGVLFIADEVQAGLCRTGSWWAFQQYGIEPDIVTVAKALANGLPMGAVMAPDEIAKGFVPGSHATTFGAGAFVSAVASKTLEIMERDNLAARAAEIGAWAMDRFWHVGEKVPGTIEKVRGKGLFIGIVLTKPGKSVWEKLLERGFLFNLAQENVLRLLPPLTVTREELEAFAVALEEVLQE